MVLNVSSGALGKGSEIVPNLALAMTTAGTAKHIFIGISICAKKQN